MLCYLFALFSEKDLYRLALQSILVVEHLFSFHFVQLSATVVVSWGFATPTSYTQIHHKKTNIKKKNLATLSSLPAFLVVASVSEERMKGSCWELFGPF